LLKKKTNVAEYLKIFARKWVEGKSPLGVAIFLLISSPKE
jgi:hypothetical protein